MTAVYADTLEAAREAEPELAWNSGEPTIIEQAIPGGYAPIPAQ